MRTMPALAAEWVVVLFVAAFGAIIIYRIFMGQIEISGLLSEPSNESTTPDAAGKASLSRVQLLLFTFIIGGLYLTLCMEAGTLLEIPNQLLGLLGISAGSFVVSKGISANSSSTPVMAAGAAAGAASGAMAGATTGAAAGAATGAAAGAVAGLAKDT